MPPGILRTRLQPPRVREDALPRPRLVERLIAGLSGRLVVIAAAAGYGKSTLLAQALPGSGRPWIWCSCDERLNGARAVLAHLAAGLAERFPGFGAGLTLQGSAEDQVAELSNEVVATIADDFVLVLDDVHALRGQAAATLALLVRDLPPLVHLALASRTAVPVPLGRLRAAGVLELGERELALSEAEAGDLLRAAGIALPEGSIAELHRRTEGWVAGLLLAARSEDPLAAAVSPADAAGWAGAEAGRDPADAIGGHLFDYLAEEVLLRQPRPTQEFLVATSVLERFTPALAEALTGRPDARAIIDSLVTGHFFIVRLAAEGEWYRYHQLFQAFLRRRIAERDPERLRELHRRAGKAWAEAGERAEAVRHFLLAEDMLAAVDALEPIAEAMVGTPEAETLGAWLDRIPGQLWSDRPGLMLAHASLLYNRADFLAAFTALESAIARLVELGEHERAALALFRLLRAMATAGGHQERAIEIGRRFLARIEPSARMAPAARVRLATIYAYASRYAEADEQLSAVEATPEGRGAMQRAEITASRAFYIDHPLGRSEAAVAALDLAIAEIERNEADDLHGLLPYATAWRAIVLNDLGRHEDALAEVPRIADAAERRGLGRVAAPVLAWLRFDALVGLRRWDELAAEIDRTTPLFASLGSLVRAHRHHAAAARLAAERGDGAAVEARVEAARAGLRASGHAFEEAMVLVDLAHAAWRAGLVRLGRDLVEEALAAADRASAPWARARGELVGATVWAGDRRGDELLGACLERSAAGGPGLVELWARRERPLAGVLLARALAAGIGPPGTAAELARACGGEVFRDCVLLLRGAGPEARAELAEVAADATGVDADTVGRLLRDRDSRVRSAARRARAQLEARPRPPLRLVTLGGFTVWLGGLPVPDSGFGRQKARALLALLLCARGPVHRDAIVEWLWPQLAPERGLAALHSTLYALRRAIEPGLARGAVSSLVLTEGETYRLALGEDDGWDAAEFLALARRASPGPARVQLDRLAAAESAYAGQLLPEWPYERWTEARRAEVEEAYRDVLERLAEALVADGRPEAAAPRYRRLLGLDPEREGWHRALMRVYAQGGERALALRQYHLCRAVLRRELGVEPSAETRALYAELLRGEADGVAAVR